MASTTDAEAGQVETARGRVLIVGGGIGGLCLAHGLHKSGIDVLVLEKAPSVATSRQGYGFHVNETGDEALRTCLPDHLYELYRATATPAPTGDFVLFTDQLQQILRRPLPRPTPRRSNIGVGVHRQTLREILAADLDNKIRYGAEFTRYDITEHGRVRAHLADGSIDTADLLVGADGTNSTVRAQLAPDAQLDDLGRSIYGRTPLTAALRERIPQDFLTGMTQARDGRGIALSATVVASAEPLASATRRLARHVTLTDPGPYLRWTLSLHGVEPAADLDAAVENGAATHGIARGLVSGWHPDLNVIVTAAEPTATYAFRIRAARPFPRWDQPRVTLLGDAVHTMTPGRGQGANTALRDAAVLTTALSRTVAQGLSTMDAVGSYESEMLDYGFRAVDDSRTPFFASGHRSTPPTSRST